MFRRNDIVMHVNKDSDAPYYPYARINKIIDNAYAEIIDVQKYVYVVGLNCLEKIPNYKGFWTKWNGKDRFIRMSTLRKLKQRAKIYNPTIFKSHKQKEQINNE